MSFTAARSRLPAINTTVGSYNVRRVPHTTGRLGGVRQRNDLHNAFGASSSSSPVEISPISDDEEYPAPFASEAAPSGMGQDYVLAMHDFVSAAPNAQCLQFRAGQVIHVLNRDETGWWDGELDGRRGWFPSNYVDAQSPQFQPPAPKPKSRSRRSRPSVSSVNFRSPTSPTQPTSIASVNGTPPLLVSLVQALSLLQNAVRARRITHFQPSTACVISCVRSVLSATDCLGRDSPALTEFPRLASARKQVLSDLARLVNQARKASESMSPDDPSIEREMAEMMAMGETVFGHVQQFLNTAVECGLQMPERNIPSPQEEEPYDRVMDTTPTPTSAEDTLGDFRRQDPLRSRGPLLDRAPSTASMRARSMVDLRGQAKAHTQRFAEYDPDSFQKSGVHRPSQGLHRTGTGSSYSGRIDYVTPRSPKQSISSASSMSSFESYADSEAAAVWPVGPTSTAQVLITLRSTHDRLLSIIAAFIGHVHSHSQNAHASSKGHLIEMTRETVDQVRQLLALVDAIMATREIALTKPRELIALEAAKTTLFAFTSSLVDSIRAITSLSASENEDEEKGTCLQAATGALRAGTECVTTVKMCLSRRIGEEPFIIYVLPPPSPESVQSSENGSQSGTAHTQSHPSTAQSSIHEEDEEEPESPDDADMGMQDSPTNEVDETLRVGQEGEAGQAGDDDEPTQYPPLPRSHQGRFENGSYTPVEYYSAPSTSSHEDDSSNFPVISVHAPDSDHQTLRDTTTPLQPVIQVDQVDGPDGLATESTSDRAHIDTNSEIPDELSQSSSEPTVMTTSSSAATSVEIEERLTPLEEKIKRGDLPSVPSTPTDPVTPSPVNPDDDTIVDDDPHQWLNTHDYDKRDIAVNADGVVTGATLEVLVEKMTSHNTTPDHAFVSAFYLTFRLFTTPGKLVDTLRNRYEIQPPSSHIAVDLKVWADRKVLPVRLRICNMFKTWLELYWRPETDNAVLPSIEDFARTKLSNSPMLAGQGQRLLLLISQRSSSDFPSAPRIADRSKPGDRLRPIPREGLPMYSTSAFTATTAPAIPPTPVMTKTLYSGLRNPTSAPVSVLDFDVLELARQLTLYESKLYCAIRPEELLDSGQAGVRPSASVRRVTSLSTSITGWVTESILNEPDTRKRTVLLKYFIKLADRCLNTLRNFSTLRAIMAALDSSTISRLTKTWIGLSARNKATFDGLRKIADHSRNHAEYRSRLRSITPPAVPFLGIYLTDIIFCRDGNSALRVSPLDPNRQLLNFHRYYQLARIVQDMQRFQEPYNLVEIPEAQKYIVSALDSLSTGTNDLQDLYRRSLLVEPRQPNDVASHDKPGKDLFGWGRLGG